MKKVQVSKRQILQSANELNTMIYHVHKGLLRSYTIDEKGKEHIYMFAPEGWTIADAVAPDLPCDLFIDALEDSIVTITQKDMSPSSFDSVKLRKRMWVMQRRITMLMSSSALQRYDHFIKTYPDIVQRVSQRMIASYLGITPEALSKAKGDRLKLSKKTD